MSRTNASGWVALAVVAAIFGASVAIRQAPGYRPDPLRPDLAARPLPIVPMPPAVAPASGRLLASPPQMALQRPPARRFRREGSLEARADAAGSIPLGRRTADANAAAAAPPRAVVEGPAPLVGRHLALSATPVVSTVAGTDGSGSRDARDARSVPEPGQDGAVRRAFSTAGRNITGGVRTAGAAIRGVF